MEDLHVNRMTHNHCLAKSIYDAQTNPGICRGRLIVPSADLSALAACSAILMKKHYAWGIVTYILRRQHDQLASKSSPLE